jgi:hypothetical protein
MGFKLKASIAAMAICMPLAAEAALSDTIAVRQRFFGPENVNPVTGAVATGKVIHAWLTNTTYAVSFSGRVALLDTFATRLEVAPGRTNFVVKDLVDLMPEAIFVGHGHGDHADNAAYIAAKTGARIYASPETCPVMTFDLNKFKNDPRIQNDPVARIDPAATINCTGVTTLGSLPGTQVVNLAGALGTDVCVLGFKHLHSVAVPRDTRFPANTVPVTVDPRDDVLFPDGIPLTPSNPPQPGQMDLRTGIGFGNNPGGPIAIAWQFIMRGGPNFSLMWTNSNGALPEGRGNGFNGTPADGARLVDMFRNVLPKTDVFMGIVSTANFPNNELRDVVIYSEAIRPKVFVPGHHTTGTIGAEGTAAALYANLVNQFKIMEQPSGSWPGFARANWPQLRWSTDPMDYAKPVVYDPKNKDWAGDLNSQQANAQRLRTLCGW